MAGAIILAQQHHHLLAKRLLYQGIFTGKISQNLLEDLIWIIQCGTSHNYKTNIRQYRN